ncbi:MAG: flagellar export chaperone FliS [Bacteroidales bacterium]|nr:flagellar export chaperone FliS [Bacteroidales bacterium]
MVHGNALNSYQKAQVYDEMDPNKLILMLYEGAIKRIVLAREGIKNADPKQRGENLGKAIAIIAELNACLDENIKTEEINFLRNLYAAMLTELPKVSVNEDIETLNRAKKYLTELRRIWETTVINNVSEKQKRSSKKTDEIGNNGLSNYTGTSQVYQNGSIAI